MSLALDTPNGCRSPSIAHHVNSGYARSKVVLPREDHRGEGLVHLECVTIAKRDPGTLKEASRGRDDTSEYHRLIFSDGPKVTDGRTRTETKMLRDGAFHRGQRRITIRSYFASPAVTTEPRE